MDDFAQHFMEFGIKLEHEELTAYKHRNITSKYLSTYFLSFLIYIENKIAGKKS